MVQLRMRHSMWTPLGLLLARLTARSLCVALISKYHAKGAVLALICLALFGAGWCRLIVFTQLLEKVLERQANPQKLR